MREVKPALDIELAVQDLAGVRVAADLGIRRVELCSALALGGLTPSVSLIQAAVEIGQETLNGPQVHVLIRPRAGGFVYTPEEIDLMVADVRAAVRAGAQGVVVGALTPSGALDLPALERLVEAAADTLPATGAGQGGGIEVTFHRAIDVCADMRAAATSLVGTGVGRILTSGGAPSAYEGRAMLADLASICGSEIQIQAAAGINPGNVRAVAETGVAAVHFSASRHIADTVPWSTERETRGESTMDFGGYGTTDPELAAATIAALQPS